MNWIIDKKPLSKYKKQGINSYKKETLKYCLECKKVWQISITGSILFYKHLPTYGLTRQTCKACKKLSIKTYEQQRR
jgi:hypothetical protein